MSTHQTLILPARNKRAHPNADRLSIIDVGPYSCIVQNSIEEGQLGIYVEPDYTVPTAHPYFNFLHKEGKDRRRITASRIRGMVSYGLFVPLSTDDLVSFKEGQDVMENFNILRYEPPFQAGEKHTEFPNYSPFSVPTNKFDLENIRHYAHVIEPTEEVIITEKLHGTNSRYTFHANTFHAGSRRLWFKAEDESVYTKSFSPSMKEWCQLHPDYILYGELAGPGIQSLTYSLTRPTFFAFAAYNPITNHWMDWDVLALSCYKLKIPTVPIIYSGPLSQCDYKSRAEENSSLSPKSLMEGVVITPLKERYTTDNSRVSYKHVSDRYYLSGH